MVLTILASILLGSIILGISRNNLQTGTVVDQNRIDILAVSLGTSIIEDATNLRFDEKSIGKDLTSKTSLTVKGSLGIESTESALNPKGFNDFDDYNCYNSNPKKDTILVPGSGKKVIFWTFCNVTYVDENDPRINAAAATWHKRISLRIFRPGMNDSANKTDTIRMSSVYSYWYFR